MIVTASRNRRQSRCVHRHIAQDRSVLVHSGDPVIPGKQGLQDRRELFAKWTVLVKIFDYGHLRMRSGQRLVIMLSMMDASATCRRSSSIAD
jgi:hypothetical protein